MKVLLQRTGGVEVWIDNKLHSSSGAGLFLLFGTHVDDRENSCGYLADKVVNLRIFEDREGKMNCSALEIGAEIMVVSQFTLYANCLKGRRPSFGEAMRPEQAEPLYNRFIDLLKESELTVRSGVFGAGMDVRFNNLGPVTIILEHGI